MMADQRDELGLAAGGGLALAQAIQGFSGVVVLDRAPVALLFLLQFGQALQCLVHARELRAARLGVGLGAPGIDQVMQRTFDMREGFEYAIS